MNNQNCVLNHNTLYEKNIHLNACILFLKKYKYPIIKKYLYVCKYVPLYNVLYIVKQSK